MTTTTVTLRTARQADAEALHRLAALDSKRALDGAVLLAEDDGVAVAAVSVADGRVVADPFRPTADLVDVLRARAQQLRGTGRRSRRLRTSRRLALG